ncbi:MAG: hypothetical protein Q4F83_10355 [Eubacteriales bacterium]|nr:hypothetical protein [Eubacteriales bacterium]
MKKYMYDMFRKRLNISPQSAMLSFILAGTVAGCLAGAAAARITGLSLGTLAGAGIIAGFVFTCIKLLNL